MGGAEEISTKLKKLEDALDPAIKSLFPNKPKSLYHFKDSFETLLKTFGNTALNELMTGKTDNEWSLLEHLGKKPGKKFWDFMEVCLKNMDGAAFKGQGEKIMEAIGGVTALNVPFVDVVETFIRSHDKDHVGQFFKMKREKGWNFLHFVSQHNEEIRILDLLQIILDKLDRPLVLDLLQERTEEGWTFLHIMCASTHKDLLFSVLDWIENNFGPKNIKNLLSNKSNNNSTCLLVLSELNEKTSVLDCLKCLTEHVKKDVLENIMMEQSDNEDSFLTVINEKSNATNLEELFVWLQKYLDKVSLKKLLILKNIYGCSFSHQIESFADKSLIENITAYKLNI